MGTYAALADADLVVRARAGDRNAFAVLYDRYFDGLHDFLTRMTRNRDEAAELVQDTFLVAMQRLESLQQPDRFKSWLFQIAYRRTLDRLEKRQRWQLTSPTPGEDGETNALLVQASTDRLDDPEDAAEANEVAGLVWEAAASLDERTFAVLDLHVRQGLSSAEIAEVLDVKPNHAYVLVNRMKERVGGAIGTYLLVRKGRRDCDGLASAVAGAELPPITEQLRKRVDRHVNDCKDCQRRQRKLLAPMQAYGALAAVPARAGVKDDIWRTLDRAWPSGELPSLLDRYRHAAAVAGAVAVVAVLPILLVLVLSGNGAASPLMFDSLTASPVDRQPQEAQSIVVGPDLGLPEPPPYEPPPPPTATPTAPVTASPTATPVPGIPPVVTITQPTEGTRTATRQDARGPYALVVLNGAADDADSPQESLQYAWSSNVDGALASGPTSRGVKLHVQNVATQCPLSNPLGTASTTHTVSLTVIDETGAVGQQSVRVTIRVGCLADLPSDPPDEPTPSPSPTESETADPAFTIACDPSSHAAGSTGNEERSSRCTATADEGFSGAIDWSCEVSRPNQTAEGVSCAITPDTDALDDGGSTTSALTISTVRATPGAWEVTVVARVNGVTRLTKVMLEVT